MLEIIIYSVIFMNEILLCNIIIMLLIPIRSILGNGEIKNAKNFLQSDPIFLKL